MNNFRQGQKVKVTTTDGHGFGVNQVVTIYEIRPLYVECVGDYRGYDICQSLYLHQIVPLFTEYYEQILHLNRGESK